MAKKQNGNLLTVSDKKNPTADRIVELVVVDGRLVADTNPGVIQ